jgi:glycosyltransferase involved in cell wall biosynthesis
MSAATRIAWLSPYGPSSDIGAFTRCLLPHFAGAANAPPFECDLYVNAHGETYDSPVPTTAIPAGGRIGEILARYDAAVFNLGNNVQNHVRVTEALRSVPGIAVLHDFSYHHFFAHKCFDELRSPPAYARFVREFYGSPGFNMALRSGVITRDATLYAPWDGENVVDYPLMQPLASLAAAVVVHSSFMEEQVRRFFQGPVLKLFLPSDQKAAPSEDDMAHWRTETAAKERCQFATFGHIGRPKCLDVIIQAMASSPILRTRAQLVIAGHPGDKEYVREIETMVAKLGLTRQVTFEYGVTNERLLAIKNESDAFLNLRFPNTEGASGSLVEMLNAGKPVIAYRAGCYAEVPDEAAVLLGRQGGIEPVATAMEYLATDPARRIAIGEAGQRHVRAQDGKRYVDLFKKFTCDVAGDLKRRARFVEPVRDGMKWTAADVLPEDGEWFAQLTRARRSLQLLERDPGAHSPEIFLTWPMDDLMAFIARVLLNVPSQTGFAALLVGYAQRLGRWPFYRLINKLCFFQSICQKPETPPADAAAYAERITDPAFWDIAMRLQPEIIVRMFYLCVLERAWGAAEAESWITRIRQGKAPASVLLDFMSSQEYRQSFPDDAMVGIEDWARHEASLSASKPKQVRLQPVWPDEATLRFSEDNSAIEAMLGRLWHHRDGQGRWSDGRTGDLCFQLPDGAARHGATLVLRLRVAGTRVTGPRQVTAHANRRELATLTLLNDIPQNWTIKLPAALHSKEGVNLLLITDQDFTPAMAGQSNDKRSLGVMLIEGRLTVDAAPAGADEEPHAEPVPAELELPDADTVYEE